MANRSSQLRVRGSEVKHDFCCRPCNHFFQNTKNCPTTNQEGFIILQFRETDESRVHQSKNLLMQIHEGTLERALKGSLMA